jgi:hypothetical protein
MLMMVEGCITDTIEDDPRLSKEISFTVTSHFAEQKEISSLCAIDKDNYYYASGNQIIITENANSSTLYVTSEVLILAFNQTDHSLWFGTKSSGLGRYIDGKIKYFTMESDGLPRNLIHYLVCDEDGAVWFSSSAHLLGGLCCYKNGKIEIFTPENSELPDNLVKSIVCKGGMVYVATGGTVGQQKVVEIDGNRWKLLPIGGYYLMNMDVDTEERLYIIDDTSLSSSMMKPRILQYENGITKNIFPDLDFMTFFYTIKTDLRNYIWLSKYQSENNIRLTVFDGKIWHDAPEDFPDIFIKCMAVDENNTIWLGTDKGIYLIKQQYGLIRH